MDQFRTSNNQHPRDISSPPSSPFQPHRRLHESTSPPEIMTRTHNIRKAHFAASTSIEATNPASLRHCWQIRRETTVLLSNDARLSSAPPLGRTDQCSLGGDIRNPFDSSNIGISRCGDDGIGLERSWVPPNGHRSKSRRRKDVCGGGGGGGGGRRGWCGADDGRYTLLTSMKHETEG
jgi:hypothetical protein